MPRATRARIPLLRLSTLRALTAADSRAAQQSFELGLANLHILKSSQVYSALLSRQQDLIAQLAKLRESMEVTEQRDSFQAKALFSHRVTMIEAELGWLDTFIEVWHEQAPKDPELVLDPAIIPRSRQVVLPHDPDSVHKQATRDLSPHKRGTPPGIKTEILHTDAEDDS